MYYDGQVVGAYVADLLVDGELLIELEAVRALEVVHVAQCIDHRKAAGLRTCLLPNFGTPRVQVRRIRTIDGRSVCIRDHLWFRFSCAR